MNKSLAVVLAFASLAAPAAAGTVPLDVFLEQRVAEELAADGTILSRLGVALEIEAVGDKLIVSLVDPATRRAVASTKLDSVPADREAAVAAVVQVTANLTAQIANQPAAASADANLVVAALRDDRREQRARDDAEYKFRQEAISFGSELAMWSNGKTTAVGSITVAYQGDMKRRLKATEFYNLVGRADLAESYDRRVAIGWTGIIGGGVASLAGAYLYAEHAFGISDCDFSSPNYDACEADFEAQGAPYKTAGMVLMGGGLVAMFVGMYYWYNRNPVDESEVYSLAAEHNSKLRTKYGLPTASLRKPRKSDHSFAVTPALLGDGGGLSVMGRF
jgi:hypothetical protein